MIKVKNDLEQALKKLNIIKNGISKEVNKHRFHLTRSEKRRKKVKKRQYKFERNAIKAGK